MGDARQAQRQRERSSISDGTGQHRLVLDKERVGAALLQCGSRPTDVFCTGYAVEVEAQVERASRWAQGLDVAVTYCCTIDKDANSSDSRHSVLQNLQPFHFQIIKE